MNEIKKNVWKRTKNYGKLNYSHDKYFHVKGFCRFFFLSVNFSRKTLISMIHPNRKNFSFQIFRIK